MHAVVLVGCFGTRLRPLTNEVPKPMLPIGNVPMIVRLAERLGEGGVTDIVLALGFGPDAFREAFPGDRVGDVRMHYAVEPEPLDTAGAIACAARASGVDSTFVVANGDIVTDLDIAGLVDAHHRLGVDATIHLTPVDDPSAYGVVETEAAGRVSRFIEKPSPGETDSDLINGGTYVLEPAVLDLIEPDRRVSVERETFPTLVADGRLAGHPTDDRWIDTGRPETYLEANLDLADRADAIHPEASIAATASIEHSIIGAGARIDGEVHGSVVLPGASIAAGATVRSSLVWGHVPADATLDSCVIGEGAEVPAGDHRGLRLPEPG